jgi:hypothetical protein
MVFIPVLAFLSGAAAVLIYHHVRRNREKFYLIELQKSDRFLSESHILEKTFYQCSIQTSPDAGDRRMYIGDFQKALINIGVRVESSTSEVLFKSFGLKEDTGSANGALSQYLDQNSFLLAVRQVPNVFRQKDEWIRSLDIHKLVAAGLPTTQEPDPVLAVAKLSAKELAAICRSIASNLEELLRTAARDYKGFGGQMRAQAPSNSKFAMTAGTFEARFGALDVFFDGLDGRIGLPNPNVIKAMEDEHCCREDSNTDFETTNYGGTRTCPKLEWQFVNSPDPNVIYPGQGPSHLERKQLGLDNFVNHETAVKANLLLAEVIGCRLFTGPMFMKYNASLRKFPQDVFDELNGNRYTTTIHAVVSAIIKLSKVWQLPPSRKVYRGLSGMVLPKAFWKKDSFGCRGGVEYACMSTTTDRNVAIQYTKGRDGTYQPTIFEIEVGQVDRGASLNWVSQYPGEQEVLMPPLSNLEVVDEPRMDGDIMVIRLRINVNNKSLTIGQLEARRQQLHVTMMRNLAAEVRPRDSIERRAPSEHARARIVLVLTLRGNAHSRFACSPSPYFRVAYGSLCGGCRPSGT